ncbi:MAG: hypothetical protein IPG99_15915 [Ignavibacteria bacterium]|nr:hypothetical protein [Ignavibacteria bacterium]
MMTGSSAILPDSRDNRILKSPDQSGIWSKAWRSLRGAFVSAGSKIIITGTSDYISNMIKRSDIETASCPAG